MIVASAIRFFYKDDVEQRFPQVWTGLRHADIYERMSKVDVRYDSSLIEGFLTHNNTFIDRYDAVYYARDCGQIELEPLIERRCLHSEDIWPKES